MSVCSEFKRSLGVIPNGIFGHRRIARDFKNPEEVSGNFAKYIESSHGSRLIDREGKAYLDFLCGYGSMVVGYQNEEVSCAVNESLSKGVCHTLPSNEVIDFSEYVKSKLYRADWVIPALSGSDAIETAVLIARKHTGKTLLVMAEKAFHGHRGWCFFGDMRPCEDRFNTRTFPWGDIEKLNEILASNEVAALVLCPYEQVVSAPNRALDKEFWREIRLACDKHDTLLIIDDIRSGFRVHVDGSCVKFGIDPDITVFSKAIANGFPLSIVVGRKALLGAAENILISGTFWGAAHTCAAGLQTLKILNREKAVDCMESLGQQLVEGLKLQALNYGFELSTTGTYACPMVLFKSDSCSKLIEQFVGLMMQRGIVMHPTHNWFLSIAHTETDIEYTISQAAQVFSQMRRMTGSQS